MVKLLATGGTIATVAGPQGRVVGKGAADLLNEASRVWRLPDVEVHDAESLVSWALMPEDVHDLHLLAGTSVPVVITHGTDTMEETAIALSLYRQPGDPPVVLTGAQRPFDDPSPDGPRNLAAAITWANSPAARGTGVSVVFGDHVLPGIGVRKSHTLSLTGFKAPGRGSFATVDEAGARKFFNPVLPSRMVESGPLDVEPIAILTFPMGGSPDLLDHLLASPQRSLVVESMGSGNTPPQITSRLVRALEDGVAVLITSRTGSGASVGLYAGGGATLASAGAAFAGDLSSAQARWVLAGARSHGQDWRQVLDRWLVQAGCLSSEGPAPR